MDSFHVHQVFDLLFSLVCHAGTLGDQILVVFHTNLSSVAGDHQVVIFSALIRELDVETEIFIYGLFEVDLAHIISSGGNIFTFHRFAVRIFHRKLDLGFRCLSDRPAV